MGKGSRNRADRRKTRQPEQTDRKIRVCANCGNPLPPVNAGFYATGNAELMDQMVMFDCPRCGAPQQYRLSHESWQDGVQVITENAADAEMVRAMVLQMFAAGASSNEVADQIETAAPAYKQFAAWLRENPWFATLSGAVLASTLTVLMTFLINRPQASKTEINNIVINQTTTVTEPPPPGPTQTP
jgi:predicted RNA-binding Zn-ribbon protein involved in translation (DUF1610 family)